MEVIKRDGGREVVAFDKILSRISKLAEHIPNCSVDLARVAQAVIAGLYDGVLTTELDVLAAETAASFAIQHTNYDKLAGLIALSNLHKETPNTFKEAVETMYTYINPRTQKAAGMISETVYQVVQRYGKEIDEWIECKRDYRFTYFGFKTLERSYLLKVDGKIIERPQYMYMRVAIGIHGYDMTKVRETYDLLSLGVISHASPTMFSAGTPFAQLSSCFLLTIGEDSIEGIYDTLQKCAKISKAAGGIGLAISDIRAKGSYISGTNGTSNGIVPMLRVFNNTAKYVDQGGNKRPGAFACYLEPWHADVFEYLDLKKNTGTEELRARDLFYAMWIPDLFMKRVEENGEWDLLCPNECPGLTDVYGKDFEALYMSYVKANKSKKRVSAQKVWKAIVDAQIETGTPYMLYKDACNEKSNQMNLGTIKCSNLCTEILQYSSREEVAVCNLASIVLSQFVVGEMPKRFDFLKLHKVAKMVTFNLNKVIDVTTYPVPEAHASNLKHRPIGIGVQGLADVFAMMHYAFDSVEAQELNTRIFETIYHGALEASNELAKTEGTYSSYKGSPASNGILQFDMWGDTGRGETEYWKPLKESIKAFGLRNSLLVAPMPTASTAQILGNNEACEPFTSNLYTRRVLSGEFQCVNKHLQTDLERIGLWTERVKRQLIEHRGSVQTIMEIPSKLKAVYKTVWELSQKTLIDMAADRGKFIDQSQSFNVFIGSPTYSKMSSMHFYGWKKGLKTGMYYLRSKPAANPIQFTVVKSHTPESNIAKDLEEPVSAVMACSLENREDCTMCGA